MEHSVILFGDWATVCSAPRRPDRQPEEGSLRALPRGLSIDTHGVIAARADRCGNPFVHARNLAPISNSAAEPETSDQALVTRHARSLEVIQQPAPLPNH